MSRKLDDELQERIRYFKSNYPRMSAAVIYRQLKSDGSVIHGQVSESTVCRFVNQLQNELRQTPNKDMRRYERPHINEVWCGDSSVGPRLTDESGKSTVFISSHSLMMPAGSSPGLMSFIMITSSIFYPL